MQIFDFEWDEKNIHHISRHQVMPDEAEEACKHHPLIVRGRDGYYLIHGRSFAGRYLLVVGLYRGNGVVRIITAREMTWAEKKLYQQHR